MMESRNIHRHPPPTRRHDEGSAPAAGTCGEALRHRGTRRRGRPSAHPGSRHWGQRGRAHLGRPAPSTVRNPRRGMNAQRVWAACGGDPANPRLAIHPWSHNGDGCSHRPGTLPSSSMRAQRRTSLGRLSRGKMMDKTMNEPTVDQRAGRARYGQEGMGMGVLMTSRSSRKGS